MQHPLFTEEEARLMTLTYVAFPTPTAPHVSGGAIDLTLGDENGQARDLGSAFDEMSTMSETRYFENNQTENEVALLNRRILYNSMTAAGFVNYQNEWWHYDFGNRAWALANNMASTQYGPQIVAIENHIIKGV